MRTFLVYLNTDQKIDTVEHGMVRGLAIANLANCASKALARDYAEIAEGDDIIGCNNDGIRWRASIDEVIIATPETAEDAVVAADADGEADDQKDLVKIIKGKLVARGGRSIAAACKRMKDNGIPLPDIINTRGSGFKQGALAKLLTEEQVAELASGLS